ncbi:hypothetical protein WJT86_04480 [Microvirga sp. W0021]|uniref:Uncharacterized protein n=1 Tax=Hohaiivirga grylli TaxID=3133970 RepID=A0ABV0BI03_9HYPH
MWKSLIVAGGLVLASTVAGNSALFTEKSAPNNITVSSDKGSYQEARTHVRSHYRRTKSGGKTRVRSHYRRR